MKLTARYPTLIALFLGLVACFAQSASANVTVLLEEPYSYDGALAGTGHTAVYLNRVCADTPTHLRRCQPGEDGVVISRYTRIAGYDWIAIPLIPYLYAVEKPADVPLYADVKLVSFLRDQYRRSYLEAIAPDDTDPEEVPKGDWVQLVGSSYDRTSYGFQIETTATQDDEFIEWLNSRPNLAVYNAVSRNCANFVRDVVNFYYPEAISRGFITDLEVTTPKHASKSLVRYSKHHPELELTAIVFPQVPGTNKRSKPIRGVLESVFRAKKYVLPLAAFHPVVAGSIVAVYFFGDRFNPAHNAMVFNADGNPQPPPTRDERQMYLKNLKAAINTDSDENMRHDTLVWREFQQRAEPGLDDSGRLIMSALIGIEEVQVGISRENVINSDAPKELRRGLLLARLRQELGKGRAPKISDRQLRQDWQLLQEIDLPERQIASQTTGTEPQRKSAFRALLHR